MHEITAISPRAASAADFLPTIFTTCHPVLPQESRVSLTLLRVNGFSAERIAELFQVSETTISKYLSEAPIVLAENGILTEIPSKAEWPERLSIVIDLIHAIFAAGATANGDTWLQQELAHEGLYLGRLLANHIHHEPEVHGLVAFMEFQASRFSAKKNTDGTPVLLGEQDRSHWNRHHIARGQTALAHADSLQKGRGKYAIKAAIAECHAVAPSVGKTNWHHIVLLYEVLRKLDPTPIVELNRIIAVSMTEGPEMALYLTDRLASQKQLTDSHLLPSLRAELFAQLGQYDDSYTEFLAAIELATNDQERAILESKLAALKEHVGW